MFRALSVQAQNSGDSPYGSYGFGELIATPQVQQALIGGAGVAVPEPYGIQQVNPAAYPYMYKPAFEFSGRGHFAKLSTETDSEQRSWASFLGFGLGVPFSRNKGGMALGLQPVTSSGYKVLETGTLSTGELVQNEYRGQGGLNRAYFGLGYVLLSLRDTSGFGNSSQLSMGANFNYLFGNLERSRKTYYPSSADAANFRDLRKYVVTDPTATVGLLWQGVLTKRDSVRTGLRYAVGISAELPAELDATTSTLKTTFVVINKVEYTRDTIEAVLKQPGVLSLPAGLAMGISLTDGYWTWTGEVRMRDWSKANITSGSLELPSRLGNSYIYSLGAIWRPGGERAARTYFDRCVWRAGARYAKDYLVVNDNQLTDMSLSLGVQLPLLRTSSRVTVGGVFGQRGSTDDGLIEERYVDVYFGISFVPPEPWFKKPRIN